MISYRPSTGNNENKVSVNSDGRFFGKSTGGAVLLNIRTNDQPKSTYYKNNYTDLSSNSNWFFKPVTDTDFLNGTTTYRAIYIGASERYDESEILGTISTAVSNDNGNYRLNGSVVLSLWMEGVYNQITSQGTLSLIDENDTFNQLAGATWTNSITYNDTLAPGHFIKVWIKVFVPSDPGLTDFSIFNYLFSVGDLTFTIQKTLSRLSYSNLFKASLDSDSIILKEAMDAEFGSTNFNGIFKIIKKEDQVNMFYITGSTISGETELHVMAAKVGNNLGEYKYIDIPLTPLFSNTELLTQQNYEQYIKAMTCELPIIITENNISGSFNNVTIAISSSGDGNYVNDVVTLLPDRKFIVDAFVSQKDGVNYAYIFYAELHSDYTPEQILNYQHILYKWVLKVATVNLDHINDNLFSTVNFGFDNRFTSALTSYYDATIKNYFYPSSVMMQDDLFTLAGFDTEDCYFKNYKGKLLFVWEKDLILRNINVQESLFPKNDYSLFRTIENLSHTPTILKFSNLSQVKPSTDFNRSLVSGGYTYVNMASPHSKAVDHGNASVSYDLSNSRINEYDTTWAFTVSGDSISTSGSKVALIDYSLFDPRSIHALYQSDYNVISGGATVAISGSNYLNQEVSIFSFNCQDDVTQKALEVTYNFNNDSWKVYSNDPSGSAMGVTISGSSPLLVPDQQSVITADIFSYEGAGGTTEDFYPGGYRINNGCLKKNIINYKIYVNGQLLVNGITYSLNNVNIYQVTHNPNGDFKGNISYWELKPRVQDLPSYVSALHKLHLNTTWASFGTEKVVNSIDPTFNNFNNRRKVTLNHLTPFKDCMVVPLVLYGNSYNINTYNGQAVNKELVRNTFNFNKLSLNTKSFGFFIEKTFVPVEFDVEPYNFDNDVLVIWLKLNNWNGEALQMFYSDTNLIENTQPNIYKDYYGVWRMDAFKDESINRFAYQSLFDVGEAVLMTQVDGNVYLTLINNIVRFGNSQLYKSQFFDVEFNDMKVTKAEMPNIQSFIRENVTLFSPGFMQIRDVKSFFNYKLESNNTGET